MRDKAVESRYVDANGQRLHYKQWSDQGPPLIFLHGVTSSCSTWDLIAPHFTSVNRVMAFDLRGHGLSSKPASGYTWVGHYAADLVAFLEMHLEEPAILVGHSLGAVVTVPVAVGAPDKVRAIVMEDPPAFRPAENTESTRSRFEPVLEAKRLPYEERVERLMEITGTDRAAAVQRADNLENMSEQVLVETIEGKTAYRADEWFPRVSCPSLVILGSPERGGVVDFDDRPRLGKLLKDITLVEWEDVGHGIHSEQPDRFIAEVKKFLLTLPN